MYRTYVRTDIISVLVYHGWTVPIRSQIDTLIARLSSSILSSIIARPFQRDGTLIAATRQPVTIRANTYSWLSTAGSAARGMGPFSSADQRTSDRPSFVMENYVCLSHGVFAVFRAGNGDITGASCGWENAFDRGSVGLECKGRWSSTCQPCFNRGWRISLGETDTRVVARRSSGYWLFIVT